VPYAIGTHRLRDVLDRLRADVLKHRIDAPRHHVMHGLRHNHSTRHGQRLEPCGDVHAVAVHGAIGLFDDVANVDANAKPHSTLLRHVSGQLRQPLLYHKRAGYRSGSSPEHGQHRIARCVDYTPTVCRDVLAEDQPRGIQRGNRCFVIQRHQARVAGHVGFKDRQQPVVKIGRVHASILADCPSRLEPACTACDSDERLPSAREPQAFCVRLGCAP
jgi:hypothetical protein